MTPNEFRSMALGMPGAAEASHMKHPDFRVGKKMFATLGYPDAAWAMVKLHPEQQAMLLAAEPDMFSSAKGAWGRNGSTLVCLDRIDEQTAMSAIRMAWSNLVKA